MSVINMLANDVWSEADIVSHGRTVIASIVPEARQSELQTIMLGHIAGLRTATAEEMAEIALVQQATEQQVADNAAARTDMALLLEVMAFEADPTLVLSEAAQAVYDLRHPTINETTPEENHV